MAEIITRAAFADKIAKLQDVLKLIPKNGYVCETCFQMYAAAQIEARRKGDVHRYYCWCDFESDPEY